MSKQYDTFVLRHDELPIGKECQITIRSLAAGKEKYRPYQVKAIVYPAVGERAAGTTLWVRTDLGRTLPQRYKIKIIEGL
ncbi:MAG: phenylphosphate carboxylase subunit gamma [Chloroflexi bacterium]|nr:phenylphosphate carboxylase subunit gamma [Chloroflexota bacterium]